MSYRIDGLGDPVTFDAGSNLLLTGNSMETDERLLDSISPADDERTIFITVDMDVDTIVTELESRGVDHDQIDVIDCTTTETTSDEYDVRKLNSPGDLTGISLEFAKLLEDDESVPVRVGMSSISTTLMYTELRTLFRFLHVFTSRIRSGEMFGAFAMDPSMHEEQATNTIRAVFDAEARIEEDGSVSLRGTGYANPN